MSSAYAQIFAAFGLTEQETPFLRALRVTNAYIGGGLALACLMGDEILPAQDMDIFYTPSATAPMGITLTLFDNLFGTAGYARSFKSTGGYQLAKALNIDFVANWINPTLRRKIQVVVRSADAPADRPAYAEADFDIAQFYLEYDVRIGDLDLKYDPEAGALTPEIVEEIRTRRVMRIGNLKGQNLNNSLRRLRKYYDRGFAFEDELVAPCSCACGHEHTVKKTQRLKYCEAAAVVRAAHARANPRPRPPIVDYSDSDSEEAVLAALTHATPAPVAAPIGQPVAAPIEQPVAAPLPPLERPLAAPAVRPPPLEIPPILEITDALETPPRPKRILPKRICRIRKDDSWINYEKE